MTARLRRLPIRARITLAFAAAVAVVLAATGLFVYARLGHSLDQAINDGLHARASGVAALVAQADTGLAESGPLDPERDGIAQILAPDGGVYDAAPGATAPLLSRDEIARVVAGETLLLDRERGVGGIDASARLLAGPADAQGRRLVVVVGASLESKEEAQRELTVALLLGGPLALLAASFLGYLVIGAALGPVEAMRRRAAEIDDDDLHERLPLPDAEDEIRRLGETLNAMLARLEQAFDRERAFVADASHELRTPLTLLKTEIELALTGDRNNIELRTALLSAGEETDRLTQLADDLLVLARSDNGRLPINQEPIQARQLLEDTALRYQRRASSSDRTIRAHTPPNLTLRGDRIRLEQALSNLLENALRHGAGTIDLSARETPTGVELHVIDQGPGIPQDFLPRAFERFTRPDEPRTRPGSGLGLAIVDVIARAHRGRAQATNTANGGADVWITLPVSSTALVDDAEPST